MRGKLINTESILTWLLLKKDEKLLNAPNTRGWMR